MPPLSGYFYHHSAFTTPVERAAARDRDRDWDRGALLIIAFVALPIMLACVVAIVLAM